MTLKTINFDNFVKIFSLGLLFLVDLEEFYYSPRQSLTDTSILNR